MTPSEWGALLLVSEYGGSAIMALAIIALVHQKLTYWPVVRLIASTALARSCYYLTSAVLDMRGQHDIADTFREPPYVLVVSGFVLVTYLWSLVLVIKQNRADKKAYVLLNGKVKPKSLREARQEVKEAMVAEGELTTELLERRRPQESKRQESYRA